MFEIKKNTWRNSFWSEMYGNSVNVLIWEDVCFPVLPFAINVLIQLLVLKRVPGIKTKN